MPAPRPGQRDYDKIDQRMTRGAIFLLRGRGARRRLANGDALSRQIGSPKKATVRSGLGTGTRNQEILNSVALRDGIAIGNFVPEAARDKTHRTE